MALSASGSDLEGGFGREQSPADLDTIADLQKLIGLLAARGYADADIAADQIIEELSKFHIAAIGIAPMKSLLRNKNGRYGDLIVGVTTLTELDQALAETDNLEGKALGKHPGIHHYTIGQRRGLGLAHPSPLYVIDLQPESHRVVVGERPQLGKSLCRVVRPNWISIAAPDAPVRVSAKIRSRHAESPATVTPMEDKSLLVEFDTPQLAVTPGQAAVFYDGDRVIGGGWITRHQP